MERLSFLLGRLVSRLVASVRPPGDDPWDVADWGFDQPEDAR